MPNCDLEMNNDLGKDLDFETLEKFFEENHFNANDPLEHWERQARTPELFRYISDHVNSTPPVNWNTQIEHDEDRYPVRLRPLSPSDVESILKSSNVLSDEISRQNNVHMPISYSYMKAMDQVDSVDLDENMEKESLADSCLFVSADGNEVFTCSFPDYSTPQNNTKQNVKSAADGSHLIFDKPPPPYSEVTDHLSKTNKTFSGPLKSGQERFLLDSGLVNGKFRPRCTDILRHQKDFLPHINETFLQRQQQTPPTFFQQQQPQDQPQHYSAVQIHKQNQQQIHQKDLNVTSIHESIREPKKRRHSSSKTCSPQLQNGYHYHHQQQLGDLPKKLHETKATQNFHFSPSPRETANGDNRNHQDVSLRRSNTEEQLTKYISPKTISSETTNGTSSGESVVSPPFVKNLSSPDQVENESDSRCAIEWFPYKNRSWLKLFSGDGKEILVLDFRTTADKGFNFSSTDDVFVCQRKNHFQVTVNFNFSHQPRFIQVEDELLPLDYLSLNFYGIKAESESHIVPIEQSESDRSKHLLQPVKISLKDLRGSLPIRAVVGRLHFGETTLNNMRKRGKPNPDQRYFRLVVCLSANIRNAVDMTNNSTEPRFPIVIHASDKIVVRASNPSLFESDPENVWIKGKNMDSICHYGNVGINTKSPAEALTVHGNIKLTGQVLDPSDARIKTNIKEMNTKEQLRNITQINVYQFRYLPSYEEYAGLRRSRSTDPLQRKKSFNSETPKVGILAQQVSQILPDAVHVVGDVVLPDGRVLEGFLVVNKDRIFIEGLGAVKELCKVTDRLERRINQLEEATMNLDRYNNNNNEQMYRIDPNKTNDWKVATIFSKNVDNLSTLPDGLSTVSRHSTNPRARQTSIKQKIKNFFKNKWAAIGFVIVMILILLCLAILSLLLCHLERSKTNIDQQTSSSKPSCGRSDVALNPIRCPPILIWPNCSSSSPCQSIQCCSGSFRTYNVIIKENDVENLQTKSQTENFSFAVTSTFVTSTSKSNNSSGDAPNRSKSSKAGKNPVPRVTENPSKNPVPGVTENPSKNLDLNIFTNAYVETTNSQFDAVSTAENENVANKRNEDGTVDLSTRENWEITFPVAAKTLEGEIANSFFSSEEKSTQIYTGLEIKSSGFEGNDVTENYLNPSENSNVILENLRKVEPNMDQLAQNDFPRKAEGTDFFNNQITTPLIGQSITNNKIAFRDETRRNKMDANYFNELIENDELSFTEKINKNVVENNLLNFDFDFNTKKDAKNRRNKKGDRHDRKMKPIFPMSGSEDDDDDGDVDNFPHGKDHTILFPQFNLELSQKYCNNKACMDGKGLSKNYLITLANNFPMNQDIDVQFSLSSIDGLVLCSWERQEFCSYSIEKSPQFDKKSMRWSLPVGSYLTSTYEFIIYDRIQEKDYSCIKSEDRRTFQLKFHRQCASDDQQPL